MAASAASAGTIAALAAQHTSSYRVKFRREEFLELVEIAKPSTIYRSGRINFFAFDGFVMYTFQCKDADFYRQRVTHAMEFSNQAWSERPPLSR